MWWRPPPGSWPCLDSMVQSLCLDSWLRPPNHLVVRMPICGAYGTSLSLGLLRTFTRGSSRSEPGLFRGTPAGQEGSAERSRTSPLEQEIEQPVSLGLRRLFTFTAGDDPAHE